MFYHTSLSTTNMFEKINKITEELNITPSRRFFLHLFIENMLVILIYWIKIFFIIDAFITKHFYAFKL